MIADRPVLGPFCLDLVWEVVHARKKLIYWALWIGCDYPYLSGCFNSVKEHDLVRRQQAGMDDADDVLQQDVHSHRSGAVVVNRPPIPVERVPPHQRREARVQRIALQVLGHVGRSRSERQLEPVFCILRVLQGDLQRNAAEPQVGRAVQEALVNGR